MNASRASGPDLVVVGAGNAGLSAAVSAAEFGLTVVLVEKTDRIGGQLHWSAGHFSAAGTRRQRELGIIDHPEFHFADVMRLSHGLANPELVRLAVYAAPAVVDWLGDNGFRFAPDVPKIYPGHESYSRPRTYWGGDDPKHGGRELLRTLTSLLETHRRSIDIRTSTRLIDLLVESDASGTRVAGVRIDGHEGAEDIRAPWTILATGGYAANRKLVAELQPRHASALSGTLDHSTGDAHLLLRNLGVPITHADMFCPTMGMIPDSTRPGFGIPTVQLRVRTHVADRLPWEVWVNDRGERFVREDHPSHFVKEAALRDQPGVRMHVIFDDQARRMAPSLFNPVREVDDLSRDPATAESVHRADSIEELALELGIPPAALAATVGDYNANLDGADPLGRSSRPAPISEAPFRAVTLGGGMQLSRGGPTVTTQLAPVKTDGEAIGGCLLVGEILGMGQFSGDTFAGGMAVGPALSCGRLAAAHAAALDLSSLVDESPDG